ncbi:uncharacterized protein H6S33_004228 [Morchella sextelata]|uniref:uncharacterized protein n=1 Tax=Morchella sextelata TaxID=1174677 RepID=UPI001D05654E|nr:uncharacterized protein H6S33_004228 [Morchella sextelata]KAH0605771.1 hypothetical protein H6S33_004228 [Morchella sextelata]
MAIEVGIGGGRTEPQESRRLSLLCVYMSCQVTYRAGSKTATGLRPMVELALAIAKPHSVVLYMHPLSAIRQIHSNINLLITAEAFF